MEINEIPRFFFLRRVVIGKCCNKTNSRGRVCRQYLLRHNLIDYPRYLQYDAICQSSRELNCRESKIDLKLTEKSFCVHIIVVLWKERNVIEPQRSWKRFLYSVEDCRSSFEWKKISYRISNYLLSTLFFPVNDCPCAASISGKDINTILCCTRTSPLASLPVPSVYHKTKLNANDRAKRLFSSEMSPERGGSRNE